MLYVFAFLFYVSQSFFTVLIFWEKSAEIHKLKQQLTVSHQRLHKERTSFCLVNRSFEEDQDIIDDCAARGHGVWPSCYIPEPAPVVPRAHKQTWPFKVRLLATVFPQFHAIPENDHFWGKGYVEWTRLKTMQQNMYGDPVRQPVESGYYNLLSRWARKRYSDLARQYGVYGFIYHHYYFDRKVVMDRPLRLMLQDGHPDTMFMLNWANEPWTRRWDGQAKTNESMLIRQTYGDERTWKHHFEYLVEFFRHPNYIRVEGCPVFSIYCPFSDRYLQTRMYQYWRELAKNTDGVGCIFIVGFITFQESRDLILDGKTADKYLDAVGEFQPHQGADLDKHGTSRRSHRKSYYWGTLSGWDNSPRNYRNPSTGRFEAKPASFVTKFGNAIRRIAERAISDPNPRGDNFVIVNAWNEWGEGSVLEPNSVYGRKLLEVVRDVMQKL